MTLVRITPFCTHYRTHTLFSTESRPRKPSFVRPKRSFSSWRPINKLCPVHKRSCSCVRFRCIHTSTCSCTMATKDGIYQQRRRATHPIGPRNVLSLTLMRVKYICKLTFCDRKPLSQHIDVSRSAQLRDIEASFTACNDSSQFDLSTLRHPNKQDITAVESFEIFPDADIWANAYDLFKFSERPGEKPIDVSRVVVFFFYRYVTDRVQHRWKIPGWIALFCDPWSLTATTF